MASSQTGIPPPHPTILKGSVSEPVNREPPLDKLTSAFITNIAQEPYERNHGPIPLLDSNTHRVTVDGLVSRKLSLSIHDLATSFAQYEVVCALQCAGNRRHTMRTRLHEVDGLDWGDGAVMNCAWRGPRVRDVLMKAGVSEESEAGQLHVAFSSYQTATQEDTYYGTSIELVRAMSEEGDVILALEQNYAPLTPTHGSPLRVIVPGIAGARSVKWLDRITVQSHESTNHYQRGDYKILPPSVKDAQQAVDEHHWDSTPALQDMPLNCVITSPRNGETIVQDKEGKVEVRGYALPKGSDGPVVSVEASTDKTDWVGAKLTGEESRWSWALWSVTLPITEGEGRCIFARATDKKGNTQPSRPEWNLRGVAYDGYGESGGLTVVKYRDDRDEG